MLSQDWDDNLWTQESVDDWMPENDPEQADLIAIDTLFEMIMQGMDMSNDRMRETIVMIRESSIERQSSTENFERES